ncbi:MAG: enoyl-CoA hydratase/isomerase family protein [Hyphomicrobiales bacterium]|nr:enoyl-CoA hydratase/isomerase family protein [Hyphomicrobiales bacterium]
MTTETIVAIEAGVMRITMNRPDKKNALTGAMYDAMTAAMEQADARDDVRAVVLEGSGGAFTAGNDLGDFLATATRGQESRAFPFIRKIATLDTPIVAAVDGVAVGVGTTLLFHCDLVYATPAAKFRMPFVDLGLLPEAGSSLLAPARFGMAKASEYILLAEAFGPQEAKDLGLVNGIVPQAELAETAMAAARKLAAKPAGALRMARQLMRGDRKDIVAAMERESAAFAKALKSPEAKAAFESFLNRAKG